MEEEKLIKCLLDCQALGMYGLIIGVLQVFII